MSAVSINCSGWKRCGIHLPGAIKTIGSNFGTPKTAEQIWTDLLTKVNTYYTGQLLFCIPADDGNLISFSFFDQVDGYYLTLSNQDLQAYEYDHYSVGNYFDGTMYAFYETNEKPLFFGLNAASLTSNRVDSETSGNLLVSPYDPQYGVGNVDLASQDYFYQVFTTVLTQLDWVSGISTRFFSPFTNDDFSSSIYGKPAMNSFINLTTQNN